VTQSNRSGEGNFEDDSEDEGLFNTLVIVSVSVAAVLIIVGIIAGKLNNYISFEYSLGFLSCSDTIPTT
jgi:hypothetical protein